MKKIKSYLKLMRIRHWFKNVIIFIPAFYGGVITRYDKIPHILSGFIVFSLCSSAVYVINDLCDIEKDRQHPVKSLRPLASGAVSKAEGIAIFIICIIVSVLIELFIFGIKFGSLIPVLYLFLNFLYSKWLKNKPIMDMVILVSGFAMRMFYGSFIAGVKISAWLYLTLIALALFMAFGKRRNEKLFCGDISRSVLSFYSETYLNSSMYMYLAIFLVFYALWSVDSGSLSVMSYTTPFVIVMVMRYTYMLEQDKHGDPIEMILGDKVLIILGMIYISFIFINIYMPEVFNECLRF